jgi:Zn-dependent peptidase ImmA (M78 family)/transcriptional regulator with XRE-family HTH domain
MDLMPADFDLVFGPQSEGATAEQRAKTSKNCFVASQDELAVYRTGATGRRYRAWEALKAFGLEKLLEASTHTSAILTTDFRRPAFVLKDRREQLGLTYTDISRKTGIDAADIRHAEDVRARTPFRILERIARALGLDETKLVNARELSGDPGLAVRLRHLKSDWPEFTANAVLAFDEAAWVIAKQNTLRQWLNSEGAKVGQFGFETDSRYGDANYPAWWHGYRLAAATRQKLGLSPTEPILSLRALIEDRLELPVVQARLPRSIAGATIANGSNRGIVVNIEGENQNVWVRRTTLAHELGHLLWDPDPSLSKLRVDLYQDFEDHPFDLADHVEARANAFAVEFLLPQTAVRNLYDKAVDKSLVVRQAMEQFGISFTSAKYQLWNSLDRRFPLNDLRTADIRPTDDWIGRESYSLDFFKPESVPETRRGNFSGVVVAAERLGLISPDSSASYLGCTEEEYLSHANLIQQLYPAPK